MRNRKLTEPPEVIIESMGIQERLCSNCYTPYIFTKSTNRELRSEDLCQKCYGNKVRRANKQVARKNPARRLI